MEKLITIIVDDVPSFVVPVNSTLLISSLVPLFENYKNYNLEFVINSNNKIKDFRNTAPAVPFETIWAQMDTPVINVTSKKEEEVTNYSTTDLYKLPKDILVKLISTIQETGNYYVVRVHYKRGEHNIVEFSSKEKLRYYLISALDLENKNRVKQDDEKYPLKKLIEMAKEAGERMIDDERGYGIVAVFKGQSL